MGCPFSLGIRTRMPDWRAGTIVGKPLPPLETPMPESIPLPAPWQSRRDAVWGDLVDFDFYNRFDGEIRKDSQVLAEGWATETLERVGRPRLTSDLFWSVFDVLHGEGVALPEALDCAVRATPELG